MSLTRSNLSFKTQQERAREQEKLSNLGEFQRVASAVPKISLPTHKAKFENICNPEVEEATLRSSCHDALNLLARENAAVVSEGKQRIEQGFEEVGLDCFLDMDVQRRLRLLFPSQRKLDDIVQLLRDAAGRAVQSKIRSRFNEMEMQLRTASRSTSDKLDTAIRRFIESILHHMSVTIGNRSDFLRSRFNTRLKSLVRAAQDGRLDSWSALSDDEDGEYIETGRNNFNASASGTFSPSAPSSSSSSVTLATVAASGAVNSPSSSQQAQSQSQQQQQQQQRTHFSSSAASGAYSSSSRIPGIQNQRVSALEKTSTCVLDELVELRERLDKMQTNRHAEIQSIKTAFEKEIASLRADASEKERSLISECTDLRVQNSELQKTCFQAGQLVQRLDLACERYRREISLIIELQRDADDGALKNLYPQLARRLTSLEREKSVESQGHVDNALLTKLLAAKPRRNQGGSGGGGGGGGGEQEGEEEDDGEEQDQEEEQEHGRGGTSRRRGSATRLRPAYKSLSAAVQSSSSLKKQHELLSAFASSLHTHEATKEAIKQNAQLQQENTSLKAELIELRNKARRFEVDVRNEASSREIKFVKEIQQLKQMLSVACEKLQNAEVAVIGTSDELVQDLIGSLKHYSSKCKSLEAELLIQETLSSADHVILSEKNNNVHTSSSSSSSSVDQADQKQQSQYHHQQHRPTSCSSASSSKRPAITPIPPNLLAHDIRSRIVRPLSAKSNVSTGAYSSSSSSSAAFHHASSSSASSTSSSSSSSSPSRSPSPTSTLSPTASPSPQPLPATFTTGSGSNNIHVLDEKRKLDQLQKQYALTGRIGRKVAAMEVAPKNARFAGHLWVSREEQEEFEKEYRDEIQREEKQKAEEQEAAASSSSSRSRPSSAKSMVGLVPTSRPIRPSSALLYSSSSSTSAASSSTSGAGGISSRERQLRAAQAVIRKGKETSSVTRASSLTSRSWLKL